MNVSGINSDDDRQMIRITGGIPIGPSFSVGFLPFSEELVQPHEGDVCPDTPLKYLDTRKLIVYRNAAEGTMTYTVN